MPIKKDGQFMSLFADIKERSILFGITVISIIISFYIQHTVYLNHDVSWILVSSKNMLQGAEFGKDIIESNPPLIWLLTIPIVYISEIFSVNDVLLYRLAIFLFTILSAYLTMSLFQFTTSAFSNSKHYFLGGVFLLLVVLLMFTGRDFGQREHISVLTFLPYIALLSRRAQNNLKNISFVLEFSIGVMAGIGFALKPYYIIIALLGLGYLWLKKQRSWLSWGEAYGAICVCVLYSIVVFVYSPQYLTDVIPFISKVYWGFEDSMLTVLSKHRVLLAMFLICSFALPFMPLRASPHLVLVYFYVFGFFLAAVWQSKGYSYHFYPVWVFLFLWYILAFLEVLKSHALVNSHKPFVKKNIITMVLSFSLSILIVTRMMWLFDWYVSDHSDMGGRGKIYTRIIDHINSHDNVETKLFSLATHPFPGFPMSSYANAKWVGDSNARTALPAIAKNRKRAVPDPVMLEVERQEKEWVLNIMMNAQPDIILLDIGKYKHGIRSFEFNILDFYLEEQEFRDVWAQYKKVKDIGRIRVYERAAL